MACRICGRDDVEFYAGRRVCKACTIARVRKWKLANPDKVAESNAKPESRAKAVARAKAWAQANPDRAREVHRNKPSRVNRSEYVRRWAEKNPERAALVRANATGRRRARKMRGRVTPTDLAAILREFGMVCHICGGEIEVGDLHFDHVVPLAAGGAHSPENIRPAHSACNWKKSGPRPNRRSSRA